MGWVGGRRIDRRTTGDGVRQFVGQAANPERLAAREQLIGLACDVAFQHAHDLGFGESFFGASFDVDAGAGIVAYAGEHDAP